MRTLLGLGHLGGLGWMLALLIQERYIAFAALTSAWIVVCWLNFFLEDLSSFKKDENRCADVVAWMKTSPSVAAWVAKVRTQGRDLVIADYWHMQDLAACDHAHSSLAEKLNSSKGRALLAGYRKRRNVAWALSVPWFGCLVSFMNYGLRHFAELDNAPSWVHFTCFGAALGWLVPAVYYLVYVSGEEPVVGQRALLETVQALLTRPESARMLHAELDSKGYLRELDLFLAKEHLKEIDSPAEALYARKR